MISDFSRLKVSNAGLRPLSALTLFAMEAYRKSMEGKLDQGVLRRRYGTLRALTLHTANSPGAFWQ